LLVITSPVTGGLYNKPTEINDVKWTVLKPFLPPLSFVGDPRKWLMRWIV
jgi:hypothetical protein